MVFAVVCRSSYPSLRSAMLPKSGWQEKSKREDSAYSNPFA